MDFYENLMTYLPDVRVLRDEPLSKHTTFKVGGPADYFIFVKNASELAAVLTLCKTENVESFIIGNGSNLLVSDEGFRGAVIAFERPEHPIRILEKSGEGEIVEIPAGALLSASARAIAAEGLQGFEFAAGIPGTLGGAVVMNAGAYGGEIKDAIVSATVLTPSGEITELCKDVLDLSYRHSAIMESGCIVISAKFIFEYGNRDEINSVIEELNAKRREKQPLEYPSAGSTFKRPEGYFAGKLIEEAGLRGHSLGGARVSEKHCGFIINSGDATATDIRELINYVIYKVNETSGVTLEPEVRFLGF